MLGLTMRTQTFLSIEYEYASAVNFKERHLSPTEIHRVSRALWRLRLYYEAYYEPYLSLAFNERVQLKRSGPYAIGQTCQPTVCEGSCGFWGIGCGAKTKSQEDFFYQMTVWELEEMECVWYHLYHQNNSLWRRPCPFCQVGCLPDQLLSDIRFCRNLHLKAINRNPESGSSFRGACSWFRQDLEVGLFGKTMDNDLSMWPHGRAREPSAGFKLLFDNHTEIRPNDKPPTIGRGAWKEFMYWGYCIWDRERLQDCRLIEDEGGESIARLDWWRSWPLEKDSWQDPSPF